MLISLISLSLHRQGIAKETYVNICNNRKMFARNIYYFAVP